MKVSCRNVTQSCQELWGRFNRRTFFDEIDMSCSPYKTPFSWKHQRTSSFHAISHPLFCVSVMMLLFDLKRMWGVLTHKSIDRFQQDQPFGLLRLVTPGCGHTGHTIPCVGVTVSSHSGPPHLVRRLPRSGSSSSHGKCWSERARATNNKTFDLGKLWQTDHWTSCFICNRPAWGILLLKRYLRCWRKGEHLEP